MTVTPTGKINNALRCYAEIARNSKKESPHYKPEDAPKGLLQKCREILKQEEAAKIYNRIIGSPGLNPGESFGNVFYKSQTEYFESIEIANSVLGEVFGEKFNEYKIGPKEWAEGTAATESYQNNYWVSHVEPAEA